MVFNRDFASPQKTTDISQKDRTSTFRADRTVGGFSTSRPRMASEADSSLMLTSPVKSLQMDAFGSGSKHQDFIVTSRKNGHSLSKLKPPPSFETDTISKSDLSSKILFALKNSSKKEQESPSRADNKSKIITLQQ